MSRTKARDIIAKPLRRLSVENVIFILACVPIDIITARLLSKLVASAIDNNLHGVLFNGVVFLIVFFSTILVKCIHQVQFKKRLTLSKHKCKISFYKALYGLPLYKLYLFDEGNLKESADDDLSSVTNRIVLYYPNIIAHFISTLAYSLYIGKYSFVSSIILLIIGILQIIPPIATKLFFEKNYTDTRDIEAKITDLILESYRGFSTIKLYNLSIWFLSRMKELHKKYQKIGFKGIKTTTAENTLSNLISTVLKYGTYAIFGLLVFNNVMDYTLGITIIALSTTMFSSMMLLFSSLTGVFVSNQAEKRLEDLLSTYSNCDKEYNSFINNNLSLNNISISFNENVILDSITLTFPKRGICLIKGKNGSGKSTLLRLLIGLINPTKGNVEFNNMNICDLTVQEIVGVISYLPQDDIQFGITAHDLFYSIDDFEKQKKAIAIGQEFGLSVDSINETPIYSLSGGEKKKVFLSFVFAQNKKVLLLDEPNNSLDEHGIMVLKRLLKERNALTIVVTHGECFDEISDYEYHIEKGMVRIEKEQY